MSRPSDRNLLFGLLALQMDFITRDALIGAMQAWVLDKGKTLGDLLVERGVLSASRRQLLEPLVDEHVQQHGGDAQQSLAALSSDGGAAAKLEQLGDDDVQHSLQQLPQRSGFEVGTRSSVSPLEDPLPNDEAPGDGVSPDADALETYPQATLDQPEQPQQRFRILRPHAQGGLGRVLVAMDQELHREVAFKEILPKHSHNHDARTRFVVEAEVTGGLEHPGIVPVYGLGHYADGRPFYAMRFIKGQSLQDAVTDFYQQAASKPPSERYENNLAFRDLINRLIDVCNAIAYAHSRKVLHRDLKPGNIMLGKFGETLVVDWGLAKAQGVIDPQSRSLDGELPIVPTSGSQSAPTMAGAVIGTPAYMSPEQAAGHLEQLGPATDVYALGATLYHVLTGAAPLKGAPIAELLTRVTAGDIPGARTLNPQAPQALDAICRKAMSKSIRDRYVTAADMAKDLEAWLADEPVSALKEPLLARARRWSRRHPALVSSVTAAVLMAAVGLSIGFVVVTGKNSELDEKNIALVKATNDATQSATKAQDEERKARSAADESRRQAEEAQRQRTEAFRQEAIAKQAEHLAKTRLYASQIAEANHALEIGNQRLSLQRLEQTQSEFRGWEYAYLDRINPIRVTLKGHEGGVYGVSFSPDGTQLVSGSIDNTLKIWDAATGHATLTLSGHSGGVSSVSFSPDGKWIVSGSADGTLKMWDAATGAERLTLKGHLGEVLSASYSPNGKQIVSGSADDTLRMWDAMTGQETLIFKGHSDDVGSVSFSPDGKRIVSGSLDHTLKVWDATTGQDTLTLKGHSDIVMSARFSPDGTRIVSGSLDKTLKVWDAATGQETLTLKGHSEGVLSVSFSPDGMQILSGSDDGTFKVWQVETGQETGTFIGHSLGVFGVSFSPDGKRIVSASWDGVLRVWDAKISQRTRTLNGHSHAVMSVSFSPDGKRIASASTVVPSESSEIKLWDTATGQETLTLKGHSGEVTRVTFSPDGRRIVCGSGQPGRPSELKVWDAATGEEMLSLKGEIGYMSCVCFSPDGKHIVGGDGDYSLKVWDAATGQKIHSLKGHSTFIRSANFSMDGKLIVSGSDDCTLKVWDAVTRQETFTLKGHSGIVSSVSFSPNGMRIVSGSFDKTLKIWDAATGQEMHTLNGHSDPVTSVCFSPDGKRIVSSSFDKTLKVWDAGTGQEMLSLSGHALGVMDASFNSDGTRIVSGSMDMTLKVWDASASR